MTAYFIAATGTGIGKTFITAGLLQYLRETGHEVHGFKPVVSGYETPKGTDPAFLLEALGRPVTEDTVAEIAPFRFREPLSPDMAAAREGREIDFEALVAFCRNASAMSGTVLIEGVGGAIVPLTTSHTTLDLMLALDLPVLLVAGSYLGSLSHSFTTVAALKAAGVRVASLVVNDAGTSEEAPAIPLADTVAALHRFLPEYEIVTLPRRPKGENFALIWSALSRQSQKAGA
jgi:dethiobiotin synthetase